MRVRLVAADAGGLLWIDRRRLIAIRSAQPITVTVGGTKCERA